MYQPVDVYVNVNVSACRRVSVNVSAGRRVSVIVSTVDV
jgi:hypothetical protein